MSEQFEIIDLTDDNIENETRSSRQAAKLASFVEHDEGFIEILDDSDAEDLKPKAVERKLEHTKENSPKALTRKPSNLPQDDKSGLKRRLQPSNNKSTKKTKKKIPSFTAPTVAAMPPGMTTYNNDDEDVHILGSVGDNALADFPHAREYCVVHRFGHDPTQHCPNCYCYVCDTEATKCIVWDQHCHATHSDPKWRQERERAAAQRHGGGHIPPRNGAPPALTANTLPGQHRRADYRNTFGSREPSAKELLESVTRVYPKEVTPPSPPFLTNLRHYQKQSLAFMCDVEHNERLKGGWLCDEVGMGKSAVVIALVATRPMELADQPTKKAILHQPKWSKDKLKVKATVIFTSVSLMGQWEDECAKHAPQLVVCRHHPPSGYRLHVKELFDADVIISSATFKWDDNLYEPFVFHRVVMDESHLLGTSSARSGIPYRLAQSAKSRWCVTATPFTSSVSELYAQLSFLDQLTDFHAGRGAYEEFLKQRVIRHTKSQRINGSDALTLPDSTTSVKAIHMSSSERTKYKTVLKSDFNRRLFGNLSRKLEAVKITYLDMMVYSPLASPLFDFESSKIKALKDDLRSLLESDPNMRAVVYTQFLNQRSYIMKAVKSLGLQVYSLTGSTNARQRDKHIRDFQSVATHGPAVFVVTMRAGSVGMTLTAASHVFIMEPCIDPATEVQAAGRIHRLGQTKQVGVTKYVYRKSFESNIFKMHRQLQVGNLSFTNNGVSPEALRVLLKKLY